MHKVAYVTNHTPDLQPGSPGEITGQKESNCHGTPVFHKTDESIGNFFRTALVFRRFRIAPDTPRLSFALCTRICVPTTLGFMNQWGPG